MKWLKELYSYLKNTLDTLPRLSLCHTRIRVDPVSQKPYLMIGPIAAPRGEATKKLYLDDLKENIDFYKTQFSSEDWIIIQYNLGGIESLQIGGTFQITEFDLENVQIKVRDRGTLQQEKWDIASTISKKHYLNLDKQSIFELGMFYQNIKTSPILQEKIQKEMERRINDALYFDVFKDTSPRKDDHEPILQKNNPPNLTLVK